MILDWSDGNQYYSLGFWDCWTNPYYETSTGGSPSWKFSGVGPMPDYEVELKKYREEAEKREFEELLQILSSGILN